MVSLKCLLFFFFFSSFFWVHFIKNCQFITHFWMKVMKGKENISGYLDFIFKDTCSESIVTVISSIACWNFRKALSAFSTISFRAKKKSTVLHSANILFSNLYIILKLTSLLLLVLLLVSSGSVTSLLLWSSVLSPVCSWSFRAASIINFLVLRSIK